MLVVIRDLPHQRDDALAALDRLVQAEEDLRHGSDLQPGPELGPHVPAGALDPEAIPGLGAAAVKAVILRLLRSCVRRTIDARSRFVDSPEPFPT